MRPARNFTMPAITPGHHFGQMQGVAAEAVHYYAGVACLGCEGDTRTTLYSKILGFLLVLPSLVGYQLVRCNLNEYAFLIHHRNWSCVYYKQVLDRELSWLEVLSCGVLPWLDWSLYYPNYWVDHYNHSKSAFKLNRSRIHLAYTLLDIEHGLQAWKMRPGLPPAWSLFLTTVASKWSCCRTRFAQSSIGMFWEVLLVR